MGGMYDRPNLVKTGYRFLGLFCQSLFFLSENFIGALNVILFAKGRMWCQITCYVRDNISAGSDKLFLQFICVSMHHHSDKEATVTVRVPALRIHTIHT